MQSAMGDPYIVEAQHQEHVFGRHAGLPGDKGRVAIEFDAGQGD